MGYLIGALIYSLVFGFLSKTIAESKGYEGGFWWGFFLGVIGLLVVGFRPDIRKMQNESNSPKVSVQQSLSQIAEPRKPAEKKWVCINCEAENAEKARFCYKCGEPRHYMWKCGNCGTMNGEKVRYCAQCGKQKEDCEEIESSAQINSMSHMTEEELREKLNGGVREKLIARIKKLKVEWLETEQLGEIGTQLKNLGVFEYKRIFSPDGMNETEAYRNGNPYWYLDGGVKRCFRNATMVPDITFETLLQLTNEVLEET